MSNKSTESGARPNSAAVTGCMRAATDAALMLPSNEQLSGRKHPVRTQARGLLRICSRTKLPFLAVSVSAAEDPV